MNKRYQKDILTDSFMDDISSMCPEHLFDAQTFYYQNYVKNKNGKLFKNVLKLKYPDMETSQSQSFNARSTFRDQECVCPGGGTPAQIRGTVNGVSTSGVVKIERSEEASLNLDRLIDDCKRNVA